jgi:hypothetical protein
MTLMMPAKVPSREMNPAFQKNELTGLVLNSSTGEPVQFAHVENYTNGELAITDKEGVFSILSGIGDTIVFSAIGFHFMKYIVTDSALTGKSLILNLDEAIYEIDEATVYMPYPYEKFRQDFLKAEITETPTDILRADLAGTAKNVGPEAYEAALARGEIEKPLTTLLKILTEDEKARIRLQKSLEKREIQDRIFEKFNVSVVKAVTGITDDNEAASFMLFCNFDEEYLVEVNPFDLPEKISEKYTEYIKKMI